MDQDEAQVGQEDGVQNSQAGTKIVTGRTGMSDQLTYMCSEDWWETELPDTQKYYNSTNVEGEFDFQDSAPGPIVILTLSS